MQVPTHSGFLARQPLATLGKLTVAALLGDALAFLVLWLTILLSSGAFVAQLIIVALSLLVVAGIVATGVRWTPLLGAVAGLGTMIGGVFTQQYFLYHLTHPAEGGPFLLSLLICAFALVALCAGVERYYKTIAIPVGRHRAGFLSPSRLWVALCWAHC